LSSIDYRGLNKITTKTIDRSEADYPRYLLDNIVGILDPDSLVFFLPHFESDPPDNAQVQDYGPRGLHFAKHTTADVDPIMRGSVLPYRLNGVDEAIDAADNDLFSMGADGTAPNEPAFSLGLAVKFNDASQNSLIARFDSTNAANEVEYIFHTIGADTLRFAIFDDVEIDFIRQTTSDALVENQWYILIGTYDGSGGTGGINIYVDGAVVGSVAADNNYTAMNNESVVTSVGYVESNAGALVNFLDGHCWGSFCTAKELSAAEVRQLTELYRRLLSL